MHLSKAAVFIAEWQKTVSSIVCVVLLGTKFDPPRDMVVPGLFILGTATSIYFAFKLYCNERWENAICEEWKYFPGSTVFILKFYYVSICLLKQLYIEISEGLIMTLLYIWTFL